MSIPDDLSRALHLARERDWDQAARLVQDIDHQVAFWIHAVVHKVEGDAENSRYWYQRAGKLDHFSMEPGAELELIAKALG